MPEALRYAEILAHGPTNALFATKRLGRELVEMETGRAIPHMFETIAERLRSNEHESSLAAYLERFRAGEPHQTANQTTSARE